MIWVYIAIGIVLGVLLTPVVIWLLIKYAAGPLFKWWMKRLMKKLGALGALNGAVPPFRIRLEQADEPTWMHQDLVEQATTEFESFGYTQIGDYTIDAIFGVTLRGLVNESQRAYAVIYDFPDELIGVRSDIVVETADHQMHTFSNCPVQGLEEPPWEHKHLIETKTEDGAIGEAIELLAATTSTESLKPAAAGQFTKMFYDAYGRKMDWQVNRGGPDADELRSNILKVHNSDGSWTEEQIDSAVQATQLAWKSAISAFVSEKTKERFLRHVTKMSAGEWEDVRDRLFIVHYSSLPDELKDELKEHLHHQHEDDDDDYDWDRRDQEYDDLLTPHFLGQPPRAGFEAALTALPEDLQYKRIARISKPWPADVYVEPAYNE